MSLWPSVIFEDQDLVVINKPAGMVVNRADTTRNVTTVQDWAEEYLKIRSTKSEARNNIKIQNSNFEFKNRGGIVHRLDKETSGVLVIAKNEESFKNLQAQFKSRGVEKTYVALVHGEVGSNGQINAPIGRLPWNRTRFGIIIEGRPAQSKYKVLSIKYYETEKQKKPLSLVEIHPETGRTHQIRVHMRHIGHPVFSDELYAGRKQMKKDRKILPRHFLHAKKIVFNHPRTGESREFEAPLSEDLVQFLEKLE